LVDETRAALAARLLSSVAPYPDLARRISQIDVRDAHDAVVMLEGDGALIHVGDERFAERLQAYLELAPTLRARVPEIDYVDLRFDERVYVRPAATSGR
jgi:cell division septal protein FtsQ